MTATMKDLKEYSKKLEQILGYKFSLYDIELLYLLDQRLNRYVIRFHENQMTNEIFETLVDDVRNSFEKLFPEIQTKSYLRIEPSNTGIKIHERCLSIYSNTGIDLEQFQNGTMLPECFKALILD